MGNADDAMVVFALLIINKAGGLVYNRTFAPGLQKLDSNDYLILAGTFLRPLRSLPLRPACADIRQEPSTASTPSRAPSLPLRRPPTYHQEHAGLPPRVSNLLSLAVS